MSEQHDGFFHRLDMSAVFTCIGIVLLFSCAITVVLLAPNYIDPTWTQPTSLYQVQVYEIADPNIYVSGVSPKNMELQSVYHLKEDFTLLAFKESDTVKIIAPEKLTKYITRMEDKELKLSSHLMLLRKPQDSEGFKALQMANDLRNKLQEEWVKTHPDWKEKNQRKPAFEIMELVEVGGKQAFAVAPVEGVLENWTEKNFTLVDGPKELFHKEPGLIYVNNPKEYRVKISHTGGEETWKYDPKEGKPIANLDELRGPPFGFRSREELIKYGEHLYAIEGCWYCHTDQTRTLVQDVVLNGSDSYPAPPSSANEYIYQEITFPGTRRIGPDMSRVGIKRPSRDWHKSHFWAPKLASRGSIMPAFQHFFDNDPRGTSKYKVGIPNFKFEALFQYLMTKGTRITPPTQAWWLGKDPIQTKEIIEGRKKIQ